jgi:REP element-mobilizing transposase RayT
MARPLRFEYKGALYHVHARGNERRKIFFTDARKIKIKGVSP